MLVDTQVSVVKKPIPLITTCTATCMRLTSERLARLRVPSSPTSVDATKKQLGEGNWVVLPSATFLGSDPLLRLSEPASNAAIVPPLSLRQATKPTASSSVPATPGVDNMACFSWPGNSEG